MEKENISDHSETNVLENGMKNQVNSVKLSNSMSSRRDQKMAMVLKLGAGDS